MMVEQLKRVRPYYYGDYYPLSPCSTRADCIAEAGKESSAAVEWGCLAIQPGIAQAFRRNRCEAEAKVFWLKGLDPNSQYEITNLDVQGSVTFSGKDLMEKGLIVEIREKPGAAVITYTKAKQ
jgi:alpha-galactosidase